MGFAWFYKYEESSASYFHFLPRNSKLEYSKPSISKISSLEKEIQSSVNEKYPEAMSLLSLREKEKDWLLSQTHGFVQRSISDKEQQLVDTEKLIPNELIKLLEDVYELKIKLNKHIQGD